MNTKKFVLEVRLPNWKLEINFSSYNTELESMIACDFSTFFRILAKGSCTRSRVVPSLSIGES
jgi:hypothetical protein